MSTKTKFDKKGNKLMSKEERRKQVGEKQILGHSRFGDLLMHQDKAEPPHTSLATPRHACRNSRKPQEASFSLFLSFRLILSSSPFA